MLFQTPYCRGWVVGEGTEASTPQNHPCEGQRCPEQLGSLVFCAPNLLYPESPEAAAGASCSHPIQDPSPPKKTFYKSLGQIPRRLDGQKGHWWQLPCSPGRPHLTNPSTTPWCEERPHLDFGLRPLVLRASERQEVRGAGGGHTAQLWGVEVQASSC